jgi:hypothetical protein
MIYIQDSDRLRRRRSKHRRVMNYVRSSLRGWQQKVRDGSWCEPQYAY